MKTIIITLFLLATFSTSYSQNSEIKGLEKIKKKLINDKNIINDSIQKVDIRINYLKSTELNSSDNSLILTETTTKSNAKIKNKPKLTGGVIGMIEKGNVVKVLGLTDGYWKVEKDSIKGYTSELYLNLNSVMKNLQKSHNKVELIKEYGEVTANKIMSHRIWIGMSQRMAKLSIGLPNNINKDVGSWGVHEQWVYKNRYLYFKDGRLTSFSYN